MKTASVNVRISPELKQQAEMGELNEEEFNFLMENGINEHREGKSKSASEVHSMLK